MPTYRKTFTVTLPPVRQLNAETFVTETLAPARQVQVEISIDEQGLAELLAPDAVKSKRSRAILGGGVIVCKAA